MFIVEEVFLTRDEDSRKKMLEDILVDMIKNAVDCEETRIPFMKIPPKRICKLCTFLKDQSGGMNIEYCSNILQAIGRR